MPEKSMEDGSPMPISSIGEDIEAGSLKANIASIRSCLKTWSSASTNSQPYSCRYCISFIWSSASSCSTSSSWRGEKKQCTPSISSSGMRARVGLPVVLTTCHGAFTRYRERFIFFSCAPMREKWS